MKQKKHIVSIVILALVSAMATIVPLALATNNDVISFTGNQYVEIPDNNAASLLNNQITISFWFKPSPAMSQLGNGYINPLAKGTAGEQEWNFKLYSNKVSFGLYAPNGEGVSSYFNTNLSTNEWTFITAKVKNNQIYLYKNGLLQDNDAYPNTIVPENRAAPVLIATKLKDNFYQGELANVAIYNKSLPAAEIRSLYRVGAHANLAQNTATYLSAANLVAWYKLNDATSQIIDSSQNQNHGQYFDHDIVATPQLVDSQTLLAQVTPAVVPATTPLTFDGRNDYVLIPDNNDFSLTNTGELSISAWVKPSTLTFPNTMGTGFVHYIQKGEPLKQEWALRMYSADNSENRANRLSTYLFNPRGGLGAGSYVQENVRAGEWIYVTATFRNNEIKIYKNGVLKDTDTYLGDPYNIVPQNTNSPLRLGGNGESYFAGELSQVAIYNHKLSAAEITTLYNSGRSTPLNQNNGSYQSANNLVAWYNGVGQNGTVTDLSGHNHQGTMHS